MTDKAEHTKFGKDEPADLKPRFDLQEEEPKPEIKKVPFNSIVIFRDSSTGTLRLKAGRVMSGQMVNGRFEARVGEATFAIHESMVVQFITPFDVPAVFANSNTSDRLRTKVGKSLASLIDAQCNMVEGEYGDERNNAHLGQLKLALAQTLLDIINQL